MGRGPPKAVVGGLAQARKHALGNSGPHLPSSFSPLALLSSFASPALRVVFPSPRLCAASGALQARRSTPHSRHREQRVSSRAEEQEPLERQEEEAVAAAAAAAAWTAASVYERCPALCVPASLLPSLSHCLQLRFLPCRRRSWSLHVKHTIRIAEGLITREPRPSSGEERNEMRTR